MIDRKSDTTLHWLFLALSLLGLALASTPVQAAPLRVMTFNVRLPLAQDKSNAWERRRDLVVETIAQTRPDIIGTQELHKLQGDYLLARLPQYAWFGAGRRGGHDDEHMAIFYRRDRLRLIDLGNFWLSDTPTVPASISWGHPYPRMATWGLMETIDGGRRFYVYNTHLPYRPEDGAARLKGAGLIVGRIAALPAEVPLILFGDFNAEPDSPVHALLSQTLADAWLAARETSGPAATFHAFTGKADRRIDWILTRGFKPQSARTVTAHRGDQYPSDHFPVMAELAWGFGQAR